MADNEEYDLVLEGQDIVKRYKERPAIDEAREAISEARTEKKESLKEKVNRGLAAFAQRISEHKRKPPEGKARQAGAGFAFSGIKVRATSGKVFNASVPDISPFGGGKKQKMNADKILF